MTESEFQELQVRAACSGTTLKEFLTLEGVKYSTYNYWSKKIKAEEASQPIAPISIRKEPRMTEETDSNAIRRHCFLFHNPFVFKLFFSLFKL